MSKGVESFNKLKFESAIESGFLQNVVTHGDLKDKSDFIVYFEDTSLIDFDNFDEYIKLFQEKLSTLSKGNITSKVKCYC